jgi:hypothetical protein
MLPNPILQQLQARQPALSLLRRLECIDRCQEHAEEGGGEGGREGFDEDGPGEGGGYCEDSGVGCCIEESGKGSLEAVIVRRSV